MHEPRYLLVLFGRALRRVDNHYRHVATLDSRYRSEHRVPLYRLVRYFALSAHARRIDQDIIPAADRDGRIYRVAGSAGNVGNDIAVRADQLVDERRFADVWLAYDRYGKRVAACILRRGELRAHCVEKIADAAAVRRRNKIRLAQTELVKIVYVIARRRVRFVDCEHDGLFTAPQNLGYLAVARQYALLYVGEEYHRVAEPHSFVSLLAHRTHDIVVAVVDTARIDKRKDLTAPFAIGVKSVARNSRHIVDNGDAPSAYPVHKCGLAYIWASYDSNYGLHIPELYHTAPKM